MIFEEEMVEHLEGLGYKVVAEDGCVDHGFLGRVAFKLGFRWNEVLEVWQNN